MHRPRRPPARLRLGRGHLGVPDRGSRRRGRPRAVHLGHLLATPPATIDERRHRRRRLRPLPPLARGHRADAAAGRRRLPVLRRLAAGRARTATARSTPPGLAFYDRLVDALLEAGITPFATLYHWDLPQALQDRGGWPERETAEHFAAYAVGGRRARSATASPHWATLNEPLCSAWIGHLEGQDGARPDRPHRGRARLVPPAARPRPGRAGDPGRGARTPQVGIVNNLSHRRARHRPARGRRRRRAAPDGHTNRWWLDPVHGRGFPADMREVYGVELPERAGDLETIAAPLDWLGLNYYFPAVVADDPAGPPPLRPAGAPARRAAAPAWTGRSTRTASRRCCCG